MSTAPRSVTRPGVSSAFAADLNSTSFTTFLPQVSQEYSTSPEGRPARRLQPCGRDGRISGLSRPAANCAVGRPAISSCQSEPKVRKMAVIKVTDIAYTRLLAPDLDLQQ